MAYTRSTLKCMVQLELETPLGKALIMNRSDFLKQASSSGAGIQLIS